MEPLKPIKRDPALQPLSRDHHDALMLCFKIRTGIAKGVSAERIGKYAAWMFEEHLEPHFRIEEELVFPVLGAQHELIVAALEQHAGLRTIFKKPHPDYETLFEMERFLDAHVRFEERILFNVIQETATAEQLKRIEQAHTKTTACDNWDDPFWLNK